MHRDILFCTVYIARTLSEAAIDFLCRNAVFFCISVHSVTSEVEVFPLCNYYKPRLITTSVCYGFTCGVWQPILNSFLWQFYRLMLVRGPCVVKLVHVYHLGFIVELMKSSFSHLVAWFCPSLKNRLWSCSLWCPDTHAALMIGTQFAHSKLEGFSIHKIYTVGSETTLKIFWHSEIFITKKVNVQYVGCLIFEILRYF